ncbi:MAG: helix-turn-helix domain-containing protein [Methylobacterium sp.]|uniref:helix-turn-helix domain-containing protein n=1 Tax=Methylobacterium sp. TaxID=409 RepID=UPI0025848EFD|nr:helix-turn-helix domain-containing protein [Methylobacterium sp.]MBY0298080.1 helix-turn-helix domain-containing protein [Methylobacterium sp.]
MMARNAGKPAMAAKSTTARPLQSLAPVAGVEADRGRSLGRSATQAKLDWLDAVAADYERVNPTTFKVAYAVAQHLNNHTREAWPSQVRLAKLIGVSETTLRASLRTLVGLGHLEQGKRGVRNANKYRLGRAARGTDAA